MGLRGCVVAASVVALGVRLAGVRAEQCLVLGALGRLKLVPELGKLVWIVVCDGLLVVHHRSHAEVVQRTGVLPQILVWPFVRVLFVGFVVFFLLELSQSGDCLRCLECINCVMAACHNVRCCLRQCLDWSSGWGLGGSWGWC